MKLSELKDNINAALGELYRLDRELIDNRTEERTICAHLAHYLKPYFSEWKVDTDYNRDGTETKTDGHGVKILPDIIIHNRTLSRIEINSPENNFIGIQVKGYWNSEKRNIDEEKLRKLQLRYGYQYIFRIELKKEMGVLLQVS